jgi:bacillithiol biosynthesis deacetylase BshB1
MPTASKCDLIVFAAHPDDAELTCGGTLLVARQQGWVTAVVDVTRGELGSLGTPEIRAREASEAAAKLELSDRANLGLPDGHLRDCDEYRLEVVRAIRERRPRVVIAPPRDDHHPDHMAVAELVRQSFYLCGIRKYLEDVPHYRPRALLHYVGSRATPPQLVVDITDVFDRKMEAIECYRSQFEGEADSPTLRINQTYFLDSIRGHARHYGSLIGVPRGEAFTSEVPLPVSDLVGLFGDDPWRSR